MNIAFLVYNFNNYSGAAFQAKILAENMDITKKNIYIFSFDQNNLKIRKNNINKNIKVINLPNNILLKVIYLTYYMLIYKIDIIHSHGFITLGLIIGILMNKPILLKTTLMGKDDFDSIIKNSKGFKKKIKLFILKHIDINIVLSNKLRQINMKYIDLSKIILIPNGVEIYNSKQILEKQGNIFCIVGMICKRKRTLEGIQYFIRNYSKYDDCKLFIIGPMESDLPEFDLKYIEKCKLLAKDYLNKKIFFTGKLNKAELNDMYKRCKSLIFLSKKEGMPNVVLEAMSFNVVPIVSSMDGVAEEIIDNERDGFILDEPFEKCIPLNCIDGISKNKLCIRKVKEKFYIKRIVKRYEEIYEKL